jgi:hypothetical protein
MHPHLVLVETIPVNDVIDGVELDSAIYLIDERLRSY